MNAKEFEEILHADGEISSANGACKILAGLKIIEKYLPKSGIVAACHDQIFACDVSELVEAGVTQEDAEALRNLNWFVDEDSLAHFA